MHIYNTLNIRSQVISPLNHGSLRTERYVRSISEMFANISQQQVRTGIYIGIHAVMP